MPFRPFTAPFALAALALSCGGRQEPIVPVLKAEAGTEPRLADGPTPSAAPSPPAPQPMPELTAEPDAGTEPSAEADAPVTPSLSLEGDERDDTRPIAAAGFPAVSEDGKRLMVFDTGIVGKAEAPEVTVSILRSQDGSLVARHALGGAAEQVGSPPSAIFAGTARERQRCGKEFAAVQKEIARGRYRVVAQVASTISQGGSRGGRWESKVADDALASVGPDGLVVAISFEGEEILEVGRGERRVRLELARHYSPAEYLGTDYDGKRVGLRARPCLRTALATPDRARLWFDAPTRVAIVAVEYEGHNGCTTGTDRATDWYAFTISP